jgi:hypothetical protein
MAKINENMAGKIQVPGLNAVTFLNLIKSSQPYPVLSTLM